MSSTDNIFRKILSGAFKETDFEKAVRETAKRQYGFSQKVEGSMLQRHGFPDLTIVLPDFVDEPTSSESVKTYFIGATFFLELKVQGGRVGAHQNIVMEEVNKAGGLAFVSMCSKDGFVTTWKHGHKAEKMHTCHVGSWRFKSGWWLRDMLKAVGQASAPVSIPLSFTEKPTSTESDS